MPKSIVSARDHETTVAYARSALENIIALKQPADPPSFEVWYVYATGRQVQLNQAINDIIQRNGSLTLADLNRMYNEHLSPHAALERVDAVGGQLEGEVDQVVALLDGALTSSATYGKNLAGTTTQLGQAVDRDALRLIVERLVTSTKAAEEENSNLRSRLEASKQTIQGLQVDLHTVRTESNTDSLTKLANRKYFDKVLADAVDNQSGKAAKVSLLMCDVDHFKKFNDTFGHPVGDHVLRLLAASIRQSIRHDEVAARYGGEEFTVVLPNTGLSDANKIAEKIRVAVMDKKLIKRSTNERLGKITVSIGVAELWPGDTAESFLERADACLYRAKHDGRNRVVCETQLSVQQLAG